MHLVLIPVGDRDLGSRGEQQPHPGTPGSTALVLIVSGALHRGLINRANTEEDSIYFPQEMFELFSLCYED